MPDFLQTPLLGAAARHFSLLILGLGLKGFALMLFAGAAALCLRRAAAAARHALWTGALAALLALPLLTLLPPLLAVPVLSPEPIALASTRDDSRIDAPETPILQSRPQLETQIGGGAVATEAISAFGSSRASRMTIWDWFLALWLLGALVAVFPTALSLWAVARLAKKSRRMPADQSAALLADAARAIGIARPVRVYLMAEGFMPMTSGLLRPTLFLPADFQAWPEAKRRAVLLHELAHVKRRDCATQCMALLACALHWFNPLAWFALRRMHIEREFACDDLVLVCGERPSNYAGFLLEIVETLRVKNHAVCAVPMASQSQIEGRVEALLDPARRRRRLKRWALGLGALALGAVAATLGVVKMKINDVWKDMTPEELAEFQHWMTAPVMLPPEVLEVQPFSEETVKAAQALRTEWDKLSVEPGKSHLVTLDEKMDQAEPPLPLPSETAQSLEPFRLAFAHFVTQPDYQVEAWLLLLKGDENMAPKYIIVRNGVMIQKAKTLAEAGSGSFPQALTDLDALLRVSRSHPYASVVDKMICIAIIGITIDVGAKMKAAVNSHEQREAVIEAFRRNRDSLQCLALAPDVNWRTADNIGMVRRLRLEGCSVPSARIDGKTTGYDLMVAMLEGMREQQQKDLPNIKDPKAKLEIEEYLRGTPELIAMTRGPWAEGRDQSWLGALGINAKLTNTAIAYQIASPGFNKATEQSRTRLKEYDDFIAAGTAPQP